LVLKPGQDFKKSTAPTPSNIFNISTFKNTMNMLHNLKEMGYTYLDTDKVDFNTKFAVAFMPGDTTVPKDLKDDYYVVTLQKPYIDNTMFESMYGISAFSQYPDRCLQILQLFNTNPDFVNTLAYGVKDTHYELDENKMVVNRSDDWSIDTKYAGNNFLLYQNEDMTEQELAYSANNWELGKLQNNAAFITPFCGFELKHDTDKDHLDESGNPLKNADGKVIEYMLVDDILKGLDEYSKEIFTKLENYDENCVDPETGKKLSYMEYMKLLYDESGQNEFKKLAVPDKASENEFTPADQYAAWFIKYYYVFG